MTIARFRKIALGLPDAIEGSHHGKTDFRVKKRVFATLGYPDKDWGMVKLTVEQQSVLVEAEPEIFRPVPGAWGKGGATNVRLGKADLLPPRGAAPQHRSRVFGIVEGG